MIGSNQLILCKAEAMVAFQEYLDKRLKQYSSEITGVSEDKINNTINLTLKEFTPEQLTKISSEKVPQSWHPLVRTAYSESD